MSPTCLPTSEPAVVFSADVLAVQVEAVVPPVFKAEKSITAFVSVTALPLPSLYVNVTFLVAASYLYTFSVPAVLSAPPLASVELAFTAVGAI